MEKLLIIDDSKFWRSVSSDFFKDYFDVFTADSGLDGIKKAFEILPDIIITDYNMPDINGIFLSLVLRKYESFENSGIFILTSSDDKINNFWAQKSGANGFYSKAIFNNKEQLSFLVNTLKNGEFYTKKMQNYQTITRDKIFEIVEKRLKEEIYEKEILNLLKYIRDEEYLILRLKDLFSELFSFNSFLTLILSESEARLYSFNTNISKSHARVLMLSYFERPTIPNSWSFYGDFNDNSLKKLKNFEKYLVRYGNKEHALLLFENASYEFKNVLELIGESLGIVFSTINNFKEYLFASQFDSLTGLYNKKVLMHKIEEYIEKYGENTVLAIFDIDNFKSINDTYGHVVGDKVLKKLSEIFLKNTSEEEICARYGGEEFVILFNDFDKALNNIESIYDEINEYNWSEVLNDNRKITISGGVAVYQSGLKITEFINTADELLYKAKRNGKNNYYVFDKYGEGVV
ncbi:diguanylate cyclase [Thermosipho affectus]|uniref:Diguanylate cyclase n=1 Tax=Thermosipho affectus TaxID=660294 RepID=A0ABX3IFE4_9BACT|nr:diguanylate cyclase [Thermosipho affectus]ONN26549.1 diguanylate cyclase [Thermosipho affectus]